jgi:hypothetical protein
VKTPRLRDLARDLAFSLALVSVLCAWRPADAAESSQRINVQVFRPGPHAGDILNTVGADLMKPGTWSVGTFFHFGKNPLVFKDTSATEDRQRMEMIRDQVALDFVGAYGIHEWVDIGIAIPFFLINDGDDVGPIEHEPISSPVVGDIRLSPRVKILDRASDSDGIAVSLELGGILGTGEENSFVSDGWAAQPAALVDLVIGPWQAAANVGVTLREQSNFLEMVDNDGVGTGEHYLEVGNEFFWKAGTRLRILGEKRALVQVRGLNLSVIADLHGAGPIDAPSWENATYIEGLVGLQLGLPGAGLTLRVGGGSGLVSGYGNTKSRVFASVSYTPPSDSDRDLDRVVQNETAVTSERQLLAVLDFDGSQAKLSDAEVLELTEIARMEALDRVGSHYDIITRENLIDLLKSHGKTLEKCQGECETETGRLIGADVVVSGAVRQVFGEYRFALKAHSTNPPRVLAIQKSSTKEKGELPTLIGVAVRKLLRKLLK